MKSLVTQKIQIQFKQSFSHAQKTRSETESILVVVENELGIKGFGEGCPRNYVTGETCESALSFIEHFKPQFLCIKNLSDIQLFIKKNSSEIDKNPAAFCAVEMALLDCLAKQNKVSIENYLGINFIKKSFQYSAVIGSSSNPVATKEQILKYNEIGFNDFKVKIHGDYSIDTVPFDLLKNIIPTASVRVDANNCFKSLEEATAYFLKFKDHFFEGIEEPLKPRSYEELKKLSQKIGVKIILDESFSKISDFNFMNHNDDFWIINLRVSKMGGLLRSLDIIKQAEQRKIPIIIGAQVGETSLLTRAALVIAQKCSNLVFQEGAFGTYLLKNDIVSKPIQFGKGGVLLASVFPCLNDHGFGFKEILVDFS